MDCALPGTSGLTATRKILESTPEQAILMLSMHSEDTLVRQALEAGARGYVLKNLSVNTVAVHRANIMDALGIHKTAELVVYAIRNGLVNIP
jgi:DNA-binding NarL/FixJ family response regulator